MSPASPLDLDWPARWAALAAGAQLVPEEGVILALSGGADSVFLLHLLARAVPRPPVVAVHVDHGLRGEESREDARFCAELAGELSVPFVSLEVGLDHASPDLEHRARRARYAALAGEAARSGMHHILTGHHADDALETLMMRWLRGTELRGLAGLARRTRLGPSLGVPPESPPVDVVRPLLDLRRSELHDSLLRAGLAWREDSSNRTPSFTRNRVRNLWLPRIEESCGPQAIENLHAFHHAVKSFEEELARHTAHLAWQSPDHAPPSPGSPLTRGGCLERSALLALPRPLLQRTLWRLFSEASGAAPSRALLERIQRDLEGGRCTRHALPGAWILQLRSDRLHLSPPSAELVTESCLSLPIPGSVTLPDGRRITAERIDAAEDRPVPRSRCSVELEAPGKELQLTVRWPRRGDRFRGLGAPGSRPLARFLADAGVARAERSGIPLVLHDEEILWVAGLRPGDRYRVRPGTRTRLLLRLHDAISPPDRAPRR